MPVPQFEIDTNTPLGALLDNVIRQAAVLDLSDFYVGAQADYDQNVISVYFSEDAAEEILKELSNTIEEKDALVSLEQTEDEHTPWILQVSPPVEEVDQTPASGEIPVAVNLSGTVDVNSTGDKSHGSARTMP